MPDIGVYSVFILYDMYLYSRSYIVHCMCIERLFDYIIVCREYVYMYVYNIVIVRMIIVGGYI